MRERIAAAIIASGLTIATGLVMKWEPPSGDRLYIAFKPVPTDPWTICYGHTAGVYKGMTATQAQCEFWLREDLADAQRTVEACIHVQMTPGQYGALVDATVNNGPKVVCGSTLQRKANEGDWEGACRELTHARNSDGGNRGWSFSGGKFYQGLRNRRFDEFGFCWPDFSNVQSGVTTTAGPTYD